MKKLIALLLATVMVLSMFAACGTEPNDEPDGSQNGETAFGETAGNGTPEVKKIIMTYATAGVEPPDLPKIQAAINEMTIRDIGVEVEFMPISVFELASTVPTKVISGEQIDIFMMAFTGTSIYEQMNLLLPLNDYINETNTPFIAANGGPGGVYDNTAENVYSIMLPNPRPVNGGFLISKADLEAAGLAEEYKDYDKITLEDLDKIFAAIKAVYPDKYPCGIVGSATRAGMTFVCDALGDSVNSGVLVGMDSTTVENFYASEPYKAYLEHVRDWYLKDYIIAVQDRAKHNLPAYAYGICKIFVLCSLVGGSFQENLETTGFDYFNEDSLPELATEKNTAEQIKMCFDAHRSGDTWKTLFD